MKPSVAAVIVAGGQGTRFGGALRKQYVKLQGRPLLWWSLRAFNRAPSVGSLIIVVPKEDRTALQKKAALWGFSKLSFVVEGGATRQASVLNGAQAVSPRYAWIAVHDAVRPLITPEAIEAVIAGARLSGAAIAALPSRDTVKIAGRGGVVASTPLREQVWLAQTPQVMRRDLLLRAHRAAKRFIGTDDAQLVERLGVRVRLVKASLENLKVTVPADLRIAQHILKGR
jgi:2-C-methyl-D-erythritol 4-phosphate cytidylyltransferase